MNIYTIPEDGVKYFVEYAARAEHKMQQALMLPPLAISLIIAVNLIVLLFLGAVKSWFTYYMAVGWAITFFIMWLIGRCRFTYAKALERQKRMFADMLFNAHVQHEIKSLTDGDDIR